MLPSLSPAQVCQALFILATCGVLTVAASPPEERQLLLSYGARDSKGDSDIEQKTEQRQSSLLLDLVARLTSLGRVPHSWFSSFYWAYLLSSMFWALQYLLDGHILQFIATRQLDASLPSLPSSQAAVAWTLMLAQAGRRLYEHVAISKPSKSKMWFVHWLLGLVFYETMSVAIWVESSDAIIHGRSALRATSRQAAAKICLGVPAFFFAWVMQYRCHAYLASLKKYSLPAEGMFQYLVCPHYTCECLLYLSLAVVVAPEGQLLGRPVFCALIFVAANLGVTARETNRWYIDKFGADKVAGRSMMIPLIY